MWGVKASIPGTLIDERENCSGGTSHCEGFHEEDFERRLLYWRTRKLRCSRDMQNVL